MAILDSSSLACVAHCSTSSKKRPVKRLLGRLLGLSLFDLQWATVRTDQTAAGTTMEQS